MKTATPKIKADTIRRRVKDRDSALELANELWPLVEDCYGTPAQCFLSGLWNACTSCDEEHLFALEDNVTFLSFCFSELNNMYPATK